jgi:polyphosphate kinase 2 (PPK2 family)
LTVADYRKQFLVEPDSNVKLRDFASAFQRKHESHEDALPESAANLRQLNELQYLTYAEKKPSLLIVLQGLDAGGKKVRECVPVADTSIPCPVGAER